MTGTSRPITWAVVPAAGAGRRFGADGPKQFMSVAGVPLLHHTLLALWNCSQIDGLAVALPADRLGSADALPAGLRGSDRVRVCAGGISRTASVRAALDLVPDDCELVLVHDGVRPCPDADLVGRVIAGALAHGACVPGVAPVDTVCRVDRAGRVAQTLVRDELRLIQTPQGFRRAVLERAYAWLAAQADPPELSDDSGLVEASGQPVQAVEGESRNAKVTVPADLARLGLVAPRVGFGYDVHRLVAGRPLKLGGIEVACEQGLLGHSDADVALHALCDALLGAAGLDDIGRMFPDTDPAWAGADSRDLLARVVQRVAEAGFAIASADLTIVAQRPRLAPQLPAMAATIAAVLGIPAGAVGVKATTEEGLGVTGSGQAIAAHALSVLTWRGLGGSEP